jgi:hypothetical protein
VGPQANRQETYPYFALPFCRGDKTQTEHYHESLGEALVGLSLENSGADLRFAVDTPNATLCAATWGDADVRRMARNVGEHYWYEAYLDDLPILDYIGEVVRAGDGPDKYFIYTHRHFDISYNGDRIIAVNVTSGGRLQLYKLERPEDTIQVAFSYSVKWWPTDVKFEDRFERYLDQEFFEHNVSPFDDWLVLIVFRFTGSRCSTRSSSSCFCSSLSPCCSSGPCGPTFSATPRRTTTFWRRAMQLTTMAGSRYTAMCFARRATWFCCQRSWALDYS